uniref:Uncharacterized protein n=2 Tax=Panagrolaimus sp. PS1159 TaxID=55785 RepID=A0AC35GK41_9BILA
MLEYSPNSSTGKRGRPKGSVSRKTLYKQCRRENALQQSAASVKESMNEQQLLHYNLSVAKIGKVQRKLDEEKLRSQEMQKQISLLQKLNQQQAEQIEIEKASRQVAVENYEREKEQRKIAEQKCQNKINEIKIDEMNYKQALIEMQRTAELEKKENAKQILTLQKNVAHLQKANDEQHAATKEEKAKNKVMVKRLEEKEKEVKNLLILTVKLQEALKEMSSTNRSLKINIDEYQNNLNQLQRDYEKVSKNFCNLKETSKIPKGKLPSINKSQLINKHRQKPYNLSSARTQRRRVQKTVQALKEVPDMAKKVLARFQQKTENKKHKITLLQPVPITDNLNVL